MSVIRSFAVLAAAVTLAVPAIAQSHPIAGTWTIEYVRGVRHENGEVSSIMGTGKLELTQRGDSVVGTLTPVVDAGTPAPPTLALAGRITGDGASLTSASTARVNMNGDEQIVKVTMTWELNAAGDALSGTMKRVVEGMDMPSDPGPVKGTRAK